MMKKKGILIVNLVVIFLIGFAQIAGRTAGLTATNEITVDSGKKITINAGEEITIKTGAASIILNKDGSITLKGKVLTIDFETVTSKGASATVIKGSKVSGN